VSVILPFPVVDWFASAAMVTVFDVVSSLALAVMV